MGCLYPLFPGSLLHPSSAFRLWKTHIVKRRVARMKLCPVSKVIPLFLAVMHQTHCLALVAWQMQLKSISCSSFLHKWLPGRCGNDIRILMIWLRCMNSCRVGTVVLFSCTFVSAAFAINGVLGKPSFSWRFRNHLKNSLSWGSQWDQGDFRGGNTAGEKVQLQGRNSCRYDGPWI